MKRILSERVARGLVKTNKTFFMCIQRSFARNIKKSVVDGNRIDLDKIRITETSVIYTQELSSERDFFYQEMLEKDNEEEMMQFYEERKDSFDGLGVKLLVMKLFQNRYVQGKPPTSKIRRTYQIEENLRDYDIIVKLLNQNIHLIKNGLSLSHFNELLQEVSKHSIRSTGFDALIIEKFLNQNALSPSQYVYDILLSSVQFSSPTYSYVLNRFEIDLVNKRFQITDIVIGMAMLESVLASKVEEMKIVRILEYYLFECSKKYVFYLDCLSIFKIYSKYNFRSPNLDLLDRLSIVIVKKMRFFPLGSLEELLRDCSNIKYNDLNLLAAINKKIFTNLTRKIIQEGSDFEMLELDNKENHNLEEESEAELEVGDEMALKKEQEMTDQELLNEITNNLFGDLSDWDGNVETLYNRQAFAIKEKVLSSDITKLPEILYHLNRLNVAKDYPVLQRRYLQADNDHMSTGPAVSEPETIILPHVLPLEALIR